MDTLGLYMNNLSIQNCSNVMAGSQAAAMLELFVNQVTDSKTQSSLEFSSPTLPHQYNLS